MNRTILHTERNSDAESGTSHLIIIHFKLIFCSQKPHNSIARTRLRMWRYLKGTQMSNSRIFVFWNFSQPQVNVKYFLLPLISPQPIHRMGISFVHLISALRMQTFTFICFLSTKVWYQLYERVHAKTGVGWECWNRPINGIGGCVCKERGFLKSWNLLQQHWGTIFTHRFDFDLLDIRRNCVT